MTAEEHATRRQLTWQYREKLRTLLADAQAAEKSAGDHVGMAGFGMMDDYAVEREKKAAAQRFGAAQARRQTIEQLWQVFAELVGHDLVAHAIQEGERRIGTIPYAD